MELPDDVLQIIKEYSRPVTRSDWKYNIIITKKILHQEFQKQLGYRAWRLRHASGHEYLRLLKYKPVFNNNRYKLFNCGYL